MKNAAKIVLTILLLCLGGCKSDRYEVAGAETEIAGLMSVGIVAQGGLAEDRLETVRFIIFKNPKTDPKIEFNKKFDIPAPDPGNGSGEVTRFKIVIETSMKTVGTNDKMIVAIVNEPPIWSSVLQAIDSYDRLNNLMVDMESFVRSDHLALNYGATMPMTGVTWTDKVYPDLSVAESDPVEIGIERALAKVEFYVRKEVGVDFDIASGTKITLRNTFDKEYFVKGGDPPDSFGMINTVSPAGFIVKEWTHSGSAIAIPELSNNDPGISVCSFYTPERTCSAPGNSDKLFAEIELKSTSEGTRTATAVLDEVYRNNLKLNIDNILRNNIYRVIVTVTDKDIHITALLTDWNSENIEIEL